MNDNGGGCGDSDDAMNRQWLAYSAEESTMFYCQK